MSQYAFGTGSLFAAATIDAQGNAIANPTPIKFGELQDISADFGRDLKMLYGQNAMPVSVAGGKMKFDFKAKFARIAGRVFNDLYFGNALGAGTLQAVQNELTGALIPATPFQITVTPPNSGTFSRDLGVMDANGVPMARVASAPATGQYSTNGSGQYTFAALDTGRRVFISYAYTATAAAARTINLTNQAMGACPVFGVDLAINFSGQQFNWRFPNCVASKLSFEPKQDDYFTAGFDFSAFTDAAGNIGYLATAE
jgi:hypothetical protein